MGLSVAPPVPAPAGPAVERPAGGPEGRVLPARVVLAVALLLLGVLVAALAVGGGSPRPATDGLPDAGPVTGWGLPVVGLLGRLLAVVTVGLLVHAALLVPAPGGRLPVPARRSSVLVTTTATLWLAAEAVGALLTASSLYAVPVASLTASGVAAALTQLDPGRASLAVVVLLAPVVLGAAVARRARTARALLVLALGAVVVPVVLAGHSAAAADHTATVVALSVHVVTASLWVGGLLALLLQRSGAASTPLVVRRFSTLALGAWRCWPAPGCSRRCWCWVDPGPVCSTADTSVCCWSRRSCSWCWRAPGGGTGAGPCRPSTSEHRGPSSASRSRRCC